MLFFSSFVNHAASESIIIMVRIQNSFLYTVPEYIHLFYHNACSIYKITAKQQQYDVFIFYLFYFYLRISFKFPVVNMNKCIYGTPQLYFGKNNYIIKGRDILSSKCSTLSDYNDTLLYYAVNLFYH